ncbi:hypothetical protein B0T19DRAFT_472606 [Cercophora scortea]|uniref:Uncharacterized protein n=1 Tax=Cercophora scortea TaxID=314031 RepID=A0AAE0J6E3_9PEZI|nr:hypothetical protein B0T19DRAFT_472606 [Cercophora scortea]
MSNNPSGTTPTGEYHARVPPSEPMVSKWVHKPGNEQGHAAAPEFHAEVHPTGHAPPSHTFTPNPINEFPTHETGADPLNMPGATSKDVYTGYGMPLQGQEGREVNPQLPGKKSGADSERAHVRGRKKEDTGLVGVGAEPGKDWVRSRGLDLPEGVEKGGRGKHTAEWPGAEEREPASAEEVGSGK